MGIFNRLLQRRDTNAAIPASVEVGPRLPTERPAVYTGGDPRLTFELERALMAVFASDAFPPEEEFTKAFFRRLDRYCQEEQFPGFPCVDVTLALTLAAQEFYEGEGFIGDLEHQFKTDAIEVGIYRDVLIRMLARAENPDRALQQFLDDLMRCFAPILQALPPYLFEKLPSCYEDGVPLYSVFDDPTDVCRTVITEISKSSSLLFLRSLFDSDKQEMRQAIAHTPLEVIFTALVPEFVLGLPEIAENNWYAHCVLLAMTRFGKTNAISWRISQLLPQVAEGRASVIVMEPKGVLTADVLEYARRSGLADRMIVIDPERQDIKINLFERLGTVGDTVARVIRVMNTVTSSLTDMQRDALTFAIRALFATEEQPTMRALTRIVRQGKAVLDLNLLSPVVRDFFEFDYKDTDGRFIISRLNALFSNQVFESLFMSDTTTFRMFDEIQSGKLIFIKAAGKSLGGDVKIYGRFWVEQVASCIWPRLSLPAHARIPTTFIIDEAQNYIEDDRHIADILDQAAEAKIGLLFAMHHMSQIKDDHVKQSIYTNTAIKISARSNADIHNLSRALGDHENLPKLLPNLPKYEFMMITPDLTKPVRVKFPLVDFGEMARALPESLALPAPALLPAPVPQLPPAPVMEEPVIEEEEPVQPPPPRKLAASKYE